MKDVEENHEFELGEDYIISPRDLCTIEIIDKLISAGIDAFKIEGRNRSPEYVKVVTECYRVAIDTGFNKSLLAKLKTVYNRGFSTGFYLGKPMNEWSKAYGSKATKKKIYIGRVKNFYKKIGVAEVFIEANRLNIGDTIMFQGPTTGVVEQKIGSMQQNHHKNVNKARVQAFLASRPKHVVHLGLAAYKGYWPWDDPAFDHVKQFLCTL